MDRDPSRAPVPDEFTAAGAAARLLLDVSADAGQWDAATRAAVLAWIEQNRGVLAVVESRVLAAERDAGTWALKGDRNFAAFLGRTSHQGPGAGHATVGRAATLEAMPIVADALLDGPVTARHVQEITRAGAGSPKLAAELATPAGQQRLVELARRLDGARFGTALKQMSASLDPASRQREHEEQRRNRSLHITHAAGGTQFSGRLDSVAGHEFVKAIDALSPRPAKDDDRTTAQRRADALMAMVQRTVTDKTTTPGAVAPVQAVVTFAQDAWMALRGAGARSETGLAGRSPSDRVPPNASSLDGRAGDGRVGTVASKGSTADVVLALRGVPAVTDEDGNAWPAGEVARLLCDCELTRAVVDSFGLPLELGRGERLFRARHWMALYASGQTTCSYPGCSMPLRYCELHHMRWWDRDGGSTDQANCAPECRFHHQFVHDHDISVTRLPDGVYEHRDRWGRLIGRGGSPGAPPDGEPPGRGGELPGKQSAEPPGETFGEYRVGEGRVSISSSAGRAGDQPMLWSA